MSVEEGTVLQEPDVAGLPLSLQELAKRTFEARKNRAILRKRIKVFIAHHHEDYAAADEIKSVLEDYGEETELDQNDNKIIRKKVEVFLSEQIPHGQKWRERIEKALDDADWFILLYPRGEDDWSWCHEEAGFFRGRIHPYTSNLVVILPEGLEVPDPLEGFQALHVRLLGDVDDRPSPKLPDTADNLMKFLRGFFGKRPYEGFDPINPAFAEDPNYEDKRLDAVNIIRAAVGKINVRSCRLENDLYIRIPLEDLMTEKGNPLGRAAVIGNVGQRLQRSTALRHLCGIGDLEGESPWSKFQKIMLNGQIGIDEHKRKAYRREMEIFFDQLGKAFRETAIHNLPCPIVAHFRSPRDHQLYIPYIDEMNIHGNGNAVVHLKFIEHRTLDLLSSSEKEKRSLGKRVEPLLTALELAVGFRWQIIDEFVASACGLSNMIQKLREIETNSRQKGLDIQLVFESFGFEASREAKEMPQETAEEEEARRKLFIEEAAHGKGIAKDLAIMLNEWVPKRKELEVAANKGDFEQAKQILEMTIPTSNRFISLVAKRLSQVMAESEYTNK